MVKLHRRAGDFPHQIPRILHQKGSCHALHGRGNGKRQGCEADHEDGQKKSAFIGAYKGSQPAGGIF